MPTGPRKSSHNVKDFSVMNNQIFLLFVKSSFPQSSYVCGHLIIKLNTQLCFNLLSCHILFFPSLEFIHSLILYFCMWGEKSENFIFVFISLYNIFSNTKISLFTVLIHIKYKCIYEKCHYTNSQAFSSFFKIDEVNFIQV